MKAAPITIPATLATTGTIPTSGNTTVTMRAPGTMAATTAPATPTSTATAHTPAGTPATFSKATAPSAATPVTLNTERWRLSLLQ